MFLSLVLCLSIIRLSPVEGQEGDVVPRIHIPRFTEGVAPWRAAVFWLGRLTLAENSGDVRVGYNEDELYLRVAVFDRLLWFTPESPPNVEESDAVSIYVDPGNGSVYRIVANLYAEAVFVDEGAGWTEAGFSPTITRTWRGNGPNDGLDDRGWGIDFRLRYSDLGLSGVPPEGSEWRLGVVVHDVDSAHGAPIPDEVWPESFDGNEPSTWGELVFGLPSYTPQPASAGGATVIREGVEDIVVPDAAVGGTIPHLCGEYLDGAYWTEWPNLNYGDEGGFSIHNQADMADWPCFARYYVLFPLDSLPSSKTIISATLTLHHWGNADWTTAYPSHIWAYSVQDPWGEGTITWNNAPLAVENLDVVRVEVLTPETSPGFPGVPYDWDVTQAVAEAYAAGNPVNLALYSSDTAYSSGKYFLSSEDETFEGRPTLTVIWGNPLAEVNKDVDVNVAAPTQGQVVTYTLTLLGNGQALTLTDHLPTQVSGPGLIQTWPVEPAAEYDAGAHRLIWTGVPSSAEQVTITFPVTVQVAGPLAVSNTAVLTDAEGCVSTDTEMFIVDPIQVWLPVILRN